MQVVFGVSKVLQRTIEEPLFECSRAPPAGLFLIYLFIYYLKNTFGIEEVRICKQPLYLPTIFQEAFHLTIWGVCYAHGEINPI